MLITVFNHVQSEERLTDSYALSDRCERRRLQVDHRAFTARLNTYYDNNDAFFSSALPHQSSHCAATQVWASVFECGEPVQHPKCPLVTMQLPGNHRDQNVISISSSALHWAVIISNVAKMSSEIDLCFCDCPACFLLFSMALGDAL